MADPTLSIIIPTAGAETLGYCLQTISQQDLIDGDEVLIIGDGPQKETEIAVEALGKPFRYVQGPHTNDWGHSQVNLGLELARGDYVMGTDDDDGYLPRALGVVRSMAVEHPEKPLIFRFVTNDRVTVWRQRDNGAIEETLIGGHNLVVPNVKDKLGLGAWTPRYRGDLDWVRAVLDSYPRKDWVWRPEILTRQRPDRTLAWWSVRTDSQFEALRRIRNECRDQMTHNQDEISERDQAAFASRVRSGKLDIWPFLFSVREETPFEYCGFALLRRVAGQMTPTYGIAEKFRGRGLARKLVQLALDGCMEDAHGDALATNAAILHVDYELGWNKIGEEGGIVKLHWPYPKP